MAPATSSFSGYFMAVLLSQMEILTSAIGTDIQISVQVSDTEGLLVECDSGGWFPQAEMTWRDSSGNTIPHSSKYYSQDGTGLLHLKMSVLLKNSTHGPVTCCFYNPATGQEKRAGIVISVIQNRRTCFQVVLQGLPLMLHVAFLPLYLRFRSRGLISDDLYSLYCGWIWDLCIMLTVLMVFFSVLILVLFNISTCWPQIDLEDTDGINVKRPDMYTLDLSHPAISTP
ncbi:selection and upkeep of intraepithelial T-cells protein 9-like [Ictidomys tridecemlineatus]|nr:selection and upkeep of intraepithelial T-cells protein 9-like [Ictidomys tridecemlineatus]